MHLGPLGSNMKEFLSVTSSFRDNQLYISHRLNFNNDISI